MARERLVFDGEDIPHIVAIIRAGLAREHEDLPHELYERLLAWCYDIESSWEEDAALDE